MTIAFVLPDLRGGGAERVNLDLAHELRGAGHAVEFVLMQAHGELLEEAQIAFPVADLKVPRARGVPLALARYLRARRPDALLAAMWPLTVIAPLARALSGHDCRVIVSEHGILSAQYKDWGALHGLALRASVAICYRMADARVGVSEGVAKDMAKLARMPVGQFTVIHNPVPPRQQPSVTAMAEAEAFWGTPPGSRIVTVGRFKAVKNHALLLRSFARMASSQARLMLVGNGEGEHALRAQAQQLGIADKVIFAGFHSDPTPFYASADLFVLSSNYEGFGNVIVEALACGLPVVSTDCPSGPAEILNNGLFGKLVPVGDEAALAEAMTTTLTEPHDREKLRARARDFAPKGIARAYLDLLRPISAVRPV